MVRELSVSLPSSEALQAALIAHAQTPQRRQSSAQQAWSAQEAQGPAHAEEEDACSQHGDTASALSLSDPHMLPDPAVRAEGDLVLPAQQANMRLQTLHTHDSPTDVPAQPSPVPSTAAQHSVYGNELYEPPPPPPALNTHLDVLEDIGDEQEPQLIPAHWPETPAAPCAPAPSSATAAGAESHASLPDASSKAPGVHTQAGGPPFCGMLRERADADRAAGASESSQAAAAEDPSSIEADSSPAGSAFRILRLSLSPPCSSRKVPALSGEALPEETHPLCAVIPWHDKLRAPLER